MIFFAIYIKIILSAALKEHIKNQKTLISPQKHTDLNQCVFAGVHDNSLLYSMLKEISSCLLFERILVK